MAKRPSSRQPAGKRGRTIAADVLADKRRRETRARVEARLGSVARAWNYLQAVGSPAVQMELSRADVRLAAIKAVRDAGIPLDQGFFGAVEKKTRALAESGEGVRDYRLSAARTLVDEVEEIAQGLEALGELLNVDLLSAAIAVLDDMRQQRGEPESWGLLLGVLGGDTESKRPGRWLKVQAGPSSGFEELGDCLAPLLDTAFGAEDATAPRLLAPPLGERTSASEEVAEVVRRAAERFVKSSSKPMPPRLTQIAADLVRVEVNAPEEASHLGRAWDWLHQHGREDGRPLEKKETWCRYAREVRRRQA